MTLSRSHRRLVWTAAAFFLFCCLWLCGLAFAMDRWLPEDDQPAASATTATAPDADASTDLYRTLSAPASAAPDTDIDDDSDDADDEEDAASGSAASALSSTTAGRATLESQRLILLRNAPAASPQSGHARQLRQRPPPALLAL